MPAKKSGTRTRRRRARKSRTAVAVEDSSSDSSSSSSSESEFESKTEAAAVKKPSAGVKLVASSSFNSSSSSSLSSSGTDLNSDNEPSTPARAANSARPRCAASPEPVYDDVAVLDRIVRSPVGLYTNDRLGCLSHIPHKTLAGSSTGSGPRPMPAAVHAEAERRRRQARRARSNFIGVLAAQEEGGEEEKKERRRLIGGMNGEGEKRERQKQKQKRQAFEALWLRAVTTEFGDELDSLRRVSRPSVGKSIRMTTSQLGLLTIGTFTPFPACLFDSVNRTSQYQDLTRGCRFSSMRSPLAWKTSRKEVPGRTISMRSPWSSRRLSRMRKPRVRHRQPTRWTRSDIRLRIVRKACRFPVSLAPFNA